jgi:hypothetical protein
MLCKVCIGRFSHAFVRVLFGHVLRLAYGSVRRDFFVYKKTY